MPVSISAAIGFIALSGISVLNGVVLMVRLLELERNPYYYSKTLSERAGWQFVAEAKPNFDLVVINIYIVIGPSFTAAVNPSNQVFVDVLNGVYPEIMGVEWGFVGVRDVAHVHVLAMGTPGANGRTSEEDAVRKALEEE